MKGSLSIYMLTFSHYFYLLDDQSVLGGRAAFG